MTSIKSRVLQASAATALILGILVPAGFAFAAIGTPTSLGSNQAISGTTLSVTTGASVPVGNTIIVTIASDGNNGNISVSDTGGNTYTKDADISSGNGGGNDVRITVWSAPVTTALSAGALITVSSPNLAKSIQAMQVSGLLTSSYVDKTATATNTGTSASSGNTITTSQSDELLVGAVGAALSTLNITGASSPWTSFPQVTPGSNGTTLLTEYQIVGSTGTYAAAGTLSASGVWSAAIVTYKARVTTVTGITSVSPEPSVVGQTYTVSWSVIESDPATPTGTVTVTGDGAGCSASVTAGSCNITSNVSSGTKTLVATYGGDSNFSGSTSAGASHQVIPVPTTPVITSPSTGTRVNTSGVAVSGTADANDTVTISGGSSSVSTTADGSGNWSRTVPLNYGPNVDTANDLTAVATDGYGNNSSASASTQVIMDNTTPIVTVNSLTTANPTPTVTGTTNDNSSNVQVLVDGNMYTTTPAAGVWSALLNTLSAEGTFTISASSTDAAGNNNGVVTGTLIYNASAPVLTLSGTSGIINTGSAAFTVGATPQNGTTLVSVTCDLNGTSQDCSSFPPVSYSSLTDGPYTFTLSATDSAGNPASTVLTFTVDTTRPVPTISSTVTDPTNATSIPVTVTFDTAVSNFLDTDLSVTNATVTGFAGGPLSYTFNLNPILSGAVTLTVPDGVADEANGSGNTSVVAASPLSFTYIPCTSGNTFDTFTLGSVNGQGGWAVTGPYDQAIVNNTYGYSAFGCKTLRISDSVTSGSFGDQIFSPSNTDEAGETSAVNGGFSGGTRKTHYEAQFDLASAIPGAMQSGLHLSVSPDRGDGARMSYLRFEDQASGIHVFFDDVTDAGPLPTEATFNEVDIATLDRTVPHTIKFTMDFVDGSANDVVGIYIDGVLVHTGTSWEDYYRYDPEQTGGGNVVPTVDSLLFRESGTADAGNAGKGFLVDNFSELSSTPSVPTPPGSDRDNDDPQRRW